MTAISLKTSLVDKISNIEDVSFLQALITIVDSKAQNPTYQFSESQIEKIQKSREQFLKGEIIENDVLMSKLDVLLAS